jgi:hypothetical protein
MNKTPYEIRLDILKLANEVLATPVHHKSQSLIQEYHAMISSNKDVSFPELPSFPTTEDILAEAEKLNKFVSQA